MKLTLIVLLSVAWPLLMFWAGIVLARVYDRTRRRRRPQFTSGESVGRTNEAQDLISHLRERGGA